VVTSDETDEEEGFKVVNPEEFVTKVVSNGIEVDLTVTSEPNSANYVYFISMKHLDKIDLISPG
jgi:hypothetical protein